MSDLRRYPGPATLVLTSLSSGPKHGYALLKDITSFSGIELGAGTLYGAIARLEKDGLVEALAGDERRRPYRLTRSGTRLLSAHLALQQRIADEGLRRLDAAWNLS